MASSTDARVPVRDSLAELAGEPGIERILIGHALRGVQIQVLLRVLLSIFSIAAVALEPPASDAVACGVIVGLYAAWCAAGAVTVAKAGLFVIRYAWLALFVDLLALSSVTIIASRSDHISWTADVLVSGFAVVPMLAATSLRPHVCAAVVIPTALVYTGSIIAARASYGEPWSLIALRAMVMATLAGAAYLLCLLQRSRVETIGTLAAQRTRLLDEVLVVENRERENLAEALHDGALQYVLGARQELDLIAGTADAESVARLDLALRESARLLRSTLVELHPAVLQASGLPAALGNLGASMRERGGFAVELDSVGWPDDFRSDVDDLLFATARELLTNVVKHARASSVQMSIELDDAVARLVVLDDGVGIDEASDAKTAAGHIGLTSRRVRIESAGGTLTIAAAPAGGTVAIAQLPVTPPAH
ncbi:ATP-binding protein [Gordonia sp. TBRC 11910]|uniref:ATP-binding protein n=1 Tax=Gordonia asplenii TaxID=2725283 RepID=A0A848KWH7_9ACTN|nr:ATP-binding protein [Gordonia asplenii]NMN99817.1 ATP-binding protein [Gordonia asplenii]